MDLMMRRREIIASQRGGTITGDLFAVADKLANTTLDATGKTVSENGMVVADYVQIVPETEYVFTITANSTGARTRRFVCYAADKSFISILASQGWMNSGQTYTTTVQMPSNAKYARIATLIPTAQPPSDKL